MTGTITRVYTLTFIDHPDGVEQRIPYGVHWLLSIAAQHIVDISGDAAGRLVSLAADRWEAPIVASDDRQWWEIVEVSLPGGPPNDDERAYDFCFAAELDAETEAIMRARTAVKDAWQASQPARHAPLN